MSSETLLKEPFVHFALAGLALFGLWTLTAGPEAAEGDAATADTSPASARPAVFVSADVVEGAKLDFVELHERDPDDAELTALVDAAVAEELLYREGRAAGLDKGDPVVRRRVVQKMRYLLEGQVETADVSDAQVDAWIAERGDAPEPSLALRHVFFDAERRTNARDDALAALDAVHGGAEEPPGGDPFALGTTLTLRPLSRYGRELGPAFADGLTEVPVGTWTLVPSTFGWHVVHVDEREAGGAASDFLREQAAWALAQQAVDAGVDAQIAALRDRYDVTVEGRP